MDRMGEKSYYNRIFLIFTLKNNFGRAPLQFGKCPKESFFSSGKASLIINYILKEAVKDLTINSWKHKESAHRIKYF